MANKTAYALFYKNKLTGCYFSRSKAVRQVDSHLGNGLFAPKWNGDVKGDYKIVPVEVSYDKLYVIYGKSGEPKFFSSPDEILDILKGGGVKVTKKLYRATTFELRTSRGTIKGKVIQVK